MYRVVLKKRTPEKQYGCPLFLGQPVEQQKNRKASTYLKGSKIVIGDVVSVTFADGRVKVTMTSECQTT